MDADVSTTTVATGAATENPSVTRILGDTWGWFDLRKLPPRVVELVYWRDVKKSGAVFGSGLVVLLSLIYYSLISVVAYITLATLSVTLSFKLYKGVIQTVQKTNDGHPFKRYLEVDTDLPEDKVRDVTDKVMVRVNHCLAELKRLIFVQDVFDSIKFGALAWCLTYVGAWFNTMTLVILAYIALFTLPKVYESNQSQIDQNLDLVKTRICELVSKVKAVIPLGKKEKEP